MTRPAALAHKRSHSHVAPSTGYTPPASYTELEDVGMHSPPSHVPPTSVPSPVEPRVELPEESLARSSARWRRSFSYEAQRAEPTTSLPTALATVNPPSTGTSTSTRHGSYAGVLRRRTRQPTGSSDRDDGLAIAAAATERGSSKRRRSGSLFTPAQSPDRRSLDHDVPLRAPHAVSRQIASPVLARFDPEMATRTTTTDDDVRTIRRRTRLSFSCLGSSVERDEQSLLAPGSVAEASLSSPAIAAAEARLLNSIRARPAPPIASRDALARQSDLIQAHAHRSTTLSLRGEDLLREAAGVLRRAEDSVSRASTLVQTQAWESRLPSVEGLPTPGHPDTRRPVVGVRLGQGWSDDSPSQPAPVSPSSPPPARRRRSSFFGLAAAASSSSASLVSPPQNTSHEAAMNGAHPSSAASTSAASTRARQFLTSLRARRPRLSRNSTAVSPPEREDQLSPRDNDSASYLRSWTLPSPPLAISSFDEEAETFAAAQLNEHLLERRRVNVRLEAGLSPPTPPLRSTLWGEPLDSDSQVQSTSRRFRGPTERANERWRRGEPPIPTFGDRSGRAEVPPYPQRAFPSWRNGSADRSQTMSTPIRAVGLESPPGLANVADTAEGDALMRRRDESPSPRGRRRVERVSSELFPTRSLNAAEEGTSAIATNRLEEERDRASFRLPLSSCTRDAAGPTSRIRFEDAEEAAPAQARGWSAPSTGPFMLSSGSDGRRMIFPHPANAAGPSVVPAGPAAHATHVENDLETRRFFEEVRSFASWSRRFSRARRDLLLTLTLPICQDNFQPPPFTFERTSRRAPEDRAPAPRLPPRRYPWESDFAAAEAGGSELRPSRSGTGDARTSLRYTSDGDTRSNASPRHARYGLADLFAYAEARRQPPVQATADAAMRQRRPIDPGQSRSDDLSRHAQRAEEANDAEASALLEDRLAQHRQHRVARLHALRHERNLMHSLLSGTAGDEEQAPNAAGPRQAGELGGTDPIPLRRDGSGLAAASEQSRSPGSLWRRRGLGEFLRGFGTGGGGRGLISLFDDDLPSFWGRDSAALDPRNYLVRHATTAVLSQGT